MGTKKIEQLTGWIKDEVLLNNNYPVGKNKVKETVSLINDKQVLETKYQSAIEGTVGIIIAGSAGGGVQSAAKLLAEAAIMSGLSATMKGEYPITVGTGFSLGEVILSKNEINYTGLEKPDVSIVVSDNGLLKVQGKGIELPNLYVDAKVSIPENLTAKVFDFDKMAGKKGSALCAIALWIEESGLLDINALKEVAAKHKYGEKLLKIIDSSKELQVV